MRRTMETVHPSNLYYWCPKAPSSSAPFHRCGVGMNGFSMTCVNCGIETYSAHDGTARFKARFPHSIIIEEEPA